MNLCAARHPPRVRPGLVVLRCTTQEGRSRIRARLTDGSLATTLKNTVDYVVTEWGVAELRGRPLVERARALIGVAHPDVRDDVEDEAWRLRRLGRG
jgi:acyl-CoA hydrolase